eukprot:m.212099 g.212099  ORF g.212099 m.212099 type:complete len:198 (-) comp53992_c0_seq6:87-680(-)
MHRSRLTRQKSAKSVLERTETVSSALLSALPSISSIALIFLLVVRSSGSFHPPQLKQCTTMGSLQSAPAMKRFSSVSIFVFPALHPVWPTIFFSIATERKQRQLIFQRRKQEAWMTDPQAFEDVLAIEAFAFLNRERAFDVLRREPKRDEMRDGIVVRLALFTRQSESSLSKLSTAELLQMVDERRRLGNLNSTMVE